MGGLTFSTSVLQNINSISVYRLFLVADLIAVVIINAIYILMRFICYINDKKITIFSIKWFNIVFGILAVLVFVAWFIDMNSFAQYVKTCLPWVK